MPAYEPHVIRPNRGEEVWVQALNGHFEVGVQLNEEQYTYLELSREQLEAFSTNIQAALLEASDGTPVVTW